MIDYGPISEKIAGGNLKVDCEAPPWETQGIYRGCERFGKNLSYAPRRTDSEVARHRCRHMCRIHDARPETVEQVRNLERVPSIHWVEGGVEKKDLDLELLMRAIRRWCLSMGLPTGIGRGKAWHAAGRHPISIKPGD